MLLIDEHFDAEGRAQRTFLALVAPNALAEPASAGAQPWQLRVSGDLAHGLLPTRALATVMTRYGRPLDDQIEVSGPALHLPDGTILTRMRWRAQVDAAGRDYLVWQIASEPPLAALAGPVAAALRHLAARLAQAAPE